MASGVMLAVGAEVIDRIAVTVANTVITESEILEQIRLTAFLNNSKPDFSGDAKRTAAERLVEQALIRREIQATGYGGSGGQGAVKLNFANDAEYRRALAEHGLTDEQVKKHLEWQNTLLAFIDARFSPGIQITEAEARNYYESEFMNEWKKGANGNPAPSFEATRPEIEQLLTEQRANQALDRWLGQARTQTQIRYRMDVFR